MFCFWKREPKVANFIFQFGIQEAITMLSLFSNLRSLGYLDTWGSAMNMEGLNEYVRTRRWDVDLIQSPACTESNVFYR